MCVHLLTILRLSHLTECLSKKSVSTLTFALSLTLLVSVSLRPLALRYQKTLELSLFLCTAKKLGAKTQMVAQYLRKTRCSELIMMVAWKLQHPTRSEEGKQETCTLVELLRLCYTAPNPSQTSETISEPRDRNTNMSKNRAEWQKSSDIARLVNMHSRVKKKKLFTTDMLKNSAFTKHEHLFQEEAEALRKEKVVWL